MNTDFYVNGVLRTDDPQADKRRYEVEALAEKLYVAIIANPSCATREVDDWDIAESSFNCAEAWLAERDRRRKEGA